MRMCNLMLACLLWGAGAAAAQERQLVATLEFEIGEATLSAEHRAQLDALKSDYPPTRYMYTFEGDHDPVPFDIVTPNASLRINERLAETRWQAAAEYLGLPPFGLVRYTGSTEARVYVQPWSAVDFYPPGAGPSGTTRAPSALQDSLARLDQELRDLRDRVEGLDSARARVPAEPETVLAVARIERLYERSDKWVDRRWWESQLGVELGILRVQPERPGHRTGATLSISNGSPAYHALDISTVLDFVRLGNDRFSVTPALRWLDWSIRIHYGDDAHAPVSFVNDSEPVFTLGANLEAQPWTGGLVRLNYAGFGARVHAPNRKLVSYDQFDLRIDQRLWPKWGLEGQAVYDERFEKALCYYGVWLARAWRMRLGEFSVRLGFVEQLDAFAAPKREDPISTVSIGFAWERWRRLTAPDEGR